MISLRLTEDSLNIIRAGMTAAPTGTAEFTKALLGLQKKTENISFNDAEPDAVTIGISKAEVMYIYKLIAGVQPKLSRMTAAKLDLQTQLEKVMEKKLKEPRRRRGNKKKSAKKSAKD